MANNFNKETAMSIVKKRSNVEIVPKSQTENKLHKNYYSINDGTPISLQQISNRLRKRLKEMDQLSNMVCIDLFFVHSNWKTLYKRKDSFSSYVRDELKISRTHAYGIINSVKMLGEFYSTLNNTDIGIDSFITDISSVLNKVGIKKLIQVSKIRDPQKKFSLVKKLISGENITSNELSMITQHKINVSHTSIKDNIIYYKKEKIIELITEDFELRNLICKTIDKYYT